MGNALAFDTYAYVKKLREAGMDERQAEIQAEALVNLIEERLAAKKDLAAVEAGLKTDLAKVEAGLKADLAKVESALKTDLAEVRREIKDLDVKLTMEIKSLEARLTTEIKSLDARLTTDIKALELTNQRDLAVAKAEIIRWVVAMGIISIGGMVGVNRFLPPAPIYAQSPGQEMRYLPPQPTAPTPPTTHPAR